MFPLSHLSAQPVLYKAHQTCTILSGASPLCSKEIANAVWLKCTTCNEINDCMKQHFKIVCGKSLSWFLAAICNFVANLIELERVHGDSGRGSNLTNANVAVFVQSILRQSPLLGCAARCRIACRAGNSEASLNATLLQHNRTNVCPCCPADKMYGTAKTVVALNSVSNALAKCNWSS